MRFFKFIINKYLITAVLFAVWVLFFDDNDIFTQRERHQHLQDTKEDVSYLKHEISRMEREYQALLHDTAQLEKYAREHYRMKRDNEDVYIIE